MNSPCPHRCRDAEQEVDEDEGGRGLLIRGQLGGLALKADAGVGTQVDKEVERDHL